MPNEQDWEVVKPDGTIKRYPVPGGWIYGVWEWRVDEENPILGRWFMITAFFVPERSTANTGFK